MRVISYPISQPFKTIIMRTRIAIASIALATFLSIAHYAYADIWESYTIILTGDEEGFDCMPELNMEFDGIGKISSSDHFSLTTSVTNSDFALPREPHNFVVNGLPLFQSGHLAWSTEDVGCFCCNNEEDVFCYTIGINTETRQVFITVTHQTGISCQNTDPGEDPDEN